MAWRCRAAVFLVAICFGGVVAAWEPLPQRLRGPEGKAQGVWKVRKAYKDGRRVPDKVLSTMTVVIVEDEMIVRTGKTKQVVFFEMDSGDLDFARRRRGERSPVGLYEFKRGSLRMIWSHPEYRSSRPSSFLITSGINYFELVREEALPDR